MLYGNGSNIIIKFNFSHQSVYKQSLLLKLLQTNNTIMSKNQNLDTCREKPLHLLSPADRDTIIKIHLTSKAKCREYLQQLNIHDKNNVYMAIKRMLSLFNPNKYELSIYIFQEYRDFIFSKC